MVKANNNFNPAYEIYNKKLEEKLGTVVPITLNIPTKILEEFTDYAVSNDHLDINSALIQVIKDASKPKKSKTSNR